MKITLSFIAILIVSLLMQSKLEAASKQLAPLMAQKIGESRWMMEGKRYADVGEQNKVTVIDYCDFLNAGTITDLYGCYDEKMGNQDEDWRLEAGDAGCIFRSGAPGKYI